MSEKKFPFDFMQCVEVYPNGAYVRTAGDTFWTQVISYHSASSTKEEYIGFSNPGNGISASAWAIKMLQYNSSAQLTAVKWSEGSISMNRMWADRATYTYS